MSRSSIRIIVGMIIGHFSLGNMMSKWDIGTTDFCRSCDDVETVDHIICHCVGLQRRRLKWFGSHKLHELDEVTGNGLINLIGFVMGIRWLRGNQN